MITLSIPQKKIYADDELTLPIGGKINDYTKATNWDVASVTKVEKATDGTETTTTVDTDNELSVTKDCTIKVYYTPKTKDFDGATKFYDYTVKAVTDDEARNNNNTYFSFNMLGEKPRQMEEINKQELESKTLNSTNIGFQLVVLVPMIIRRVPAL